VTIYFLAKVELAIGLKLIFKDELFMGLLIYFGLIFLLKMIIEIIFQT
jgi:hypothetical protein